jgi:uncharacterized membrane protein YbhN (UPF0104 family)
VSVSDGLLTVGLRSLVGQVAFVLTLIVALALLMPAAKLPLVGVVLALVAVVVAYRRWLRLWVLPWPEPTRWRWLQEKQGRWLGAAVAKLRRHRLAPRDLVWPIALALVARVGSIALLVVSLRAIGAEAAVGTAVAVYLAALVAHATLPMFGGAGVVEGAATAALVQSGLSADDALVAALLWRLIGFWLPLGIGLVAYALTLLDPIVPWGAMTDPDGRRPVLPVASGRPVRLAESLAVASAPPRPRSQPPDSVLGTERTASASQTARSSGRWVA